MTLGGFSVPNSAFCQESSSTLVFGADLHKRKLENFASSPDYSDQPLDRMKKHQAEDDFESRLRFWALSGEGLSRKRMFPSTSDAERPLACESSTRGELEPESTRLQFFVRTITEGKTIVVLADRNDTIEHLHRIIEHKTGIPIIEQRLIYRGKQLEYEKSLGDYSIEKDSSVNLAGRMRSTEHPVAWQVMDDVISTVCRMCRGEPLRVGNPNINDSLTVFFSKIPRDNSDVVGNYMHIFLASSAPSALVMLYLSSVKGNRFHAEISIGHVLSNCRNLSYNHCIPIVLEFCKLLRKFAPDQHLYSSCRGTLRSILEWVLGSCRMKDKNESEELSFFHEIFPFISELAIKISKDLDSSMNSFRKLETLSQDVYEFSAFLRHWMNTMEYRACGPVSVTLPLQKSGNSYSLLEHEICYLHVIYKHMFCKMGKCLDRVEQWLAGKINGNSESMPASWSEYLAILKVINRIYKFVGDPKERILGFLKHRKASLCALILSFAKRTDDHQWILEYKEVTNFEARRHLIMMMFPDVKEDFEELHEMLINRSHLLAESFEYIGIAEPEQLRGGLLVEFENEEATGPGVLREWFFLVAQALFNPENALFLSSPLDRRRFYPNPASKVDPLHLKYFAFSGRMIALALVHKVQVGVLLDRTFFLRLAGTHVSLEDIRETDPVMYSSCKQILEMDAEFIDSDALGLTFVVETEELGKRTMVELCEGGKSITVNSDNRFLYIELLINHRFVTSVSEQVSHFSRGFTDILSYPRPLISVFHSLELEDLDWMLRGRESAINVDDWKEHTEYNGYNHTDDQIDWFWRIVKEMTEGEKRALLFFWTSIKFLPAEGFAGLSSKLQIFKMYGSQDRLPMSHTCFYRISLPNYPTFALMEERLRLLTNAHISSSFGNW